MFNPSNISVEAEYQRQELLRVAEQRRLVREFKQSQPNRLTLNTLLSVIRPAGEERRPAPRVPAKSH